MPVHFTYKEIDDPNASLRQGDILTITSEIESILSEYHPHYKKNPANLYYIILTQSCDLEIRSNGKCKTPYITIAPIRSLSHILEYSLKISEIPLSQVPVCKAENKGLITDSLTKILNNNYPDYFYLHKEPTRMFPKSCCVMLRLPISFKTEHYEKLLKARMITLDDEFRDKLGWLVGNIYSRVGTRDWEQGELKAILKQEMDKISWISKEALSQLKEAILRRPEPDQEITSSELNSIFGNIVVDTRDTKKKYDERIEKILPEITGNLLTETQIKKVVAKLQSDPVIRSFIK